MQKFFENSTELNNYISEMSDGTAILAFSTGKDSVVSWLKMKRHFKKIVPYYMYLVPGLEFVEKSLKYYEEFFETHIIRIPHNNFFTFLDDLVCASPETADACLETGTTILKEEELQDLVRRTSPDLANAYVGVGVRSADSIMRRNAINKYGSVNHVRKQFYPVYDYKLAEMEQELETAQIALPIDYEWFGRTFDGLDARFTAPLKKHAPNDYEKIKAFFPMIDTDILRHEWRKNYV
jgi:hypothetical protein